MSDVKWIKLSTNMFEDEKIRLIEQMPEADTILIIWVKLLSQAGKTNASGYIYLSENIPYTEEMLATIFNRPIGTVRLALETFKSFGMIEIDDQSFISISNWEKHQNVEGMERVRKLNAERNRRYRQRKKQNQIEENKDSDVSVTSRDDTEGDIEEDIDKEKERESEREKKPKDFTAKIKDLLPSFYSIPDFNHLSKKYWNSIRETRKTKSVAESVIYKNMKLWTSYDPVVVEYALKQHIENHAGKKEDYTIGIMRNTTLEEAKERSKVIQLSDVKGGLSGDPRNYADHVGVHGVRLYK